MFGTRSSSQLTAWVASCESCRKNCTVTRIGRLWDAILVTDDGFGALMCQKCVQSQIRLGEWGGGGGGDTIGGGGGRGVGEPRTGIIYMSMTSHLVLSTKP